LDTATSAKFDGQKDTFEIEFQFEFEFDRFLNGRPDHPFGRGTRPFIIRAEPFFSRDWQARHQEPILLEIEPAYCLEYLCGKKQEAPTFSLADVMSALPALGVWGADGSRDGVYSQPRGVRFSGAPRPCGGLSSQGPFY